MTLVMRCLCIVVMLGGILACSEFETPYFKDRVNEATMERVGKRYGAPINLNKWTRERRSGPTLTEEAAPRAIPGLQEGVPLGPTSSRLSWKRSCANGNRMSALTDGAGKEDLWSIQTIVERDLDYHLRFPERV
jgi:hypothetical protein